MLQYKGVVGYAAAVCNFLYLLKRYQKQVST